MHGKPLIVVIITTIISLMLGAESRSHSPHDNIMAIAASPAFDSDKTLFCGLNHINFYIMKSTNAGETWHPSQIGFPHFRILSIVVSPDYQADGMVVVGTRGGGIYCSTDCGDSWFACNGGLTNLADLEVNTIIFSPFFCSDRTVLIGTNDGVFLSQDGCNQWESSDSLALPVIRSMAISPAFESDGTCFAGHDSGILRSTDGGWNWHELSATADYCVTALAVSPRFSQDNVIFAGTAGDGVFKSRDRGDTWRKKSGGISDLVITSLAVAPCYPKVPLLLAATCQYIYKSNNDGDSWEVAGVGLDTQASQTETHYFGFAFSAAFAQDRTVFLAAWEGIHKSTNGADEWRHIDVYSQNLIRGLAISPDYAHDGRLFAGAYGAGVYRTKDRGLSWQKQNTNLSFIYAGPLAVSPDFAADGLVFAGLFRDIARWRPEVSCWGCVEVNPDHWFYCRALAISPDFAQDGTLFAGNGSTGEFGIYKSVDRGDSYISLCPPFRRAYSLAVSPSFAQDRIVFAGSERGVFRSEDRGATWQNIGLSEYETFTLRTSPSFDLDAEVLAGTLNGGVFRSIDRGDTWFPVNEGLGDLVIEDFAISPEYTIDSTLFAATKSEGVFRSTDRGTSWQYLDLRGRFVRTLVISPDYANDTTLFAGTWESVFKSENGGDSWTPMLRFIVRDDQSEFIIYEGLWTKYPNSFSNGSGLKFTEEPQASAEMLFRGTSIAWVGARCSQGGIANVYIDGVFQEAVDLYSAQLKGQRRLFSRGNLSNGPHRISIEATGLSHPASLGQAVIIDAFEYGF